MPKVEAASLVLYHHPFSRAAAVVGMLEEVEQPYQLVFVDLKEGQQRSDEFRHRNMMGKLPTLDDSGLIVTESAAIGLYLADRYGAGQLAPEPSDPARGTYYRWAMYAPSVVEPAAIARGAKWEYRPAQAGWGRYDDVLDTLTGAIAADSSGPWLLGERFTMADIIFGGTLRYMLQFEMIEPREEFVAYTNSLSVRPSQQRAQAVNASVIVERGLD